MYIQSHTQRNCANGGITFGTSDKHADVVRVQRTRAFSHYTAAKLFLEGTRILDKDPNRAEEIFASVVQIEPDNPYGWVYLLFAREDSGCLLSKLIMTCNKLVGVADKKHIHGLGGLSKNMMINYLRQAEALGLKIR